MGLQPEPVRSERRQPHQLQGTAACDSGKRTSIDYTDSEPILVTLATAVP